MNLTKNEKKVLKILLENSKVSDLAISEKLKISSQAIGKIRKKLESTIIDSYTLSLNYEKLGIHAFALSTIKTNFMGSEKNFFETEKKILEDPHIIQAYRIPSGSKKYFLLYGFHDLNELDNFFHNRQKNKELYQLIENEEVYPFSHYGLMKNNPKSLFFKIIDSMGGCFQKVKFNSHNEFNNSLTKKGFIETKLSN
jgi:DNA-binding Lrp family transcriptional regulator